MSCQGIEIVVVGQYGGFAHHFAWEGLKENGGGGGGAVGISPCISTSGSTGWSLGCLTFRASWTCGVSSSTPPFPWSVLSERAAWISPLLVRTAKRRFSLWVVIFHGR